VEPRLIRGSGGVFEVVMDGETIFSKRQQGRFPEESEVLEKIPPG
jgi:selenoprotein W-related protein